MNQFYLIIISLVLPFIFSCGEKKTEGDVNANCPNFSLTADGNKVTIDWESSANDSFDIWRSFNQNDFDKIVSGIKGGHHIDEVDMGNNESLLLTYRIVPVGMYVYSSDAKKNEQEIRIFKSGNDAMLDDIQKQTLKYFFEFAHPDCKLARERSNKPADMDVVTTGGTGFGIMALIAGAERQFITRQQAFSHIREITDFLMRVETFHGAFAHWYFGNTGQVKPFSQKDNGGDMVETSFLMAGLLTARQYFNMDTPEEKKLVEDITKLWEAVEWDFYTQDKNNITWHWSKEYGFEMNMAISGWNEGLITYVLAAASPTHSIKKEVYTEGYARNGGIKNGKSYYDIVLPLGNDGEMGGPLFFTHYSFLGLDPNGLSDQFCSDYFEQNRSHTLINRAYCIDNPKGHKGYSEKFWGLTASDCPANEWHYLAHAPGANDNGTVTPTAALSSMPYAPEECLEVAKYMYYDLGERLMGEYGFYDAVNFNVSENEQVYKSHLAIDQGPIVVMIENYRSGLIWKTFMKDKDVLNGLKKLGFSSPYIK